MKIVEKSNDTVKFMDLEIGDIFFCSDKTFCFMKTEDSIRQGSKEKVVENSVNLLNGLLHPFSGFAEVRKVNATLVIGGEEDDN